MLIGTILGGVSIALAILGLLASAAAWWSMERARRKEEMKYQRSIKRSDFAAKYTLRWSLLDYYMLFLFCFGFVFLLSDVVGIASQPDRFPSWHFGYVLIGAAVLLHVFLYFIARFVFLLRTKQKRVRR